MIKAELQPKEIMELMGHSTIQLTMDTYGHLFPKSAGHAARINAAMNAAMEAAD
jgi:integrase